MTKFAIFDSYDRRASRYTETARELVKERDSLNDESLYRGLRLTYAIGMIFPDGRVTFDFG
jgi:hypothetical protein